MQPEIDIGPITLQTFGLCFALGFILAGAVLAIGVTAFRRRDLAL